MEKYLRLANTFILIGILVVLILILIRLPQNSPCPADFAKARDNKSGLQELMLRIPLVHIQGTVPVDVQNSSLDVNVENYELDVNVTNSYLSVRGY